MLFFACFTLRFLFCFVCLLPALLVMVKRWWFECVRFASLLALIVGVV